MNQTVKSTCPYCGVGCGVEIKTLSQGNYQVTADHSHPANQGRLCTKGSHLAPTLKSDTRIAEPTIKGDKTSWAKTCAYLGSKLTQTIAQHGPDSVAFYLSGQLLTEDYYVANKLMKGFIGSGNVDTNSRLCMSSAVEAHKRAFGRDCAPVCYSDLEQAQLIVLVGSNLAWCHPVLYQRIRAAKAARPQLKLVVIDPRQTASCELADLHLAINNGGDLALFNGLLAYLAEQGCGSTEYFEVNGVQQSLAAAQHGYLGIAQLAQELGVETEALQTFFAWFAEYEQTVSAFAMGINQSQQGVDQASAIINCHLFTNRLGRGGMGPMSLTGQPNAMGGREVGGMATSLAAHLGFQDQGAVELLSDFWGSERIAQSAGVTAVDLFEQVASGQIKAIWIMGTNPVVSMPDSLAIKQALTACPLVILSEAYTTSETCQYADVILPACSWGEKSGTVTNSERRISRQRAFKAPYAEAKPDWWIIAEVAKAMGFARAFDYHSPAQIFAEHAKLSGLAAKLTKSFDICGLAQLSEQGYERMPPMQWPQQQAQLFELQDIRLFADGRFYTPNGKPNMVALYERPLAQVDPKPSKLTPLVLNSGRNRDQWHTLTRTGLAEQLNLHAHEPELILHPLDAELRELKDGSIVAMGNEQGRMLIRLKCSEQVRSGEAFVPMHYSGEFYSQASINRLVRPKVDPHSKQPALKSSTVSVQATAVRSEAMVLSRNKLALELLPEYWVYHRVSGGYLYYLAADIQAMALVDKLSELLSSTEDSKQVNRLDGGAQAEQRISRTALVDGQILWSIQACSHGQRLDSSWLVDAFCAPVDGPLKCALLSGKAFGEQDKGKMLCLCMKVGTKQIERVIDGQAAPCIESVGEQTGAGTRCGSCISDIAKVIYQA